jgi:hypothetical protein
MVVIGSIAGSAATGFGLTAASIAVFGFAAHARPALTGAGEEKLRHATVVGGLTGLSVSLLVILLSALIG